MAILQDKFLHLVHLVLTPLGTLLILSLTNKLMALPLGRPASPTTAKIYMQAYERTALTTALHPPKVWERFLNDVYSIFKRSIWKTFSIISTIFIKILTTGVS